MCIAVKRLILKKRSITLKINSLRKNRLLLHKLRTINILDRSSGY